MDIGILNYKNKKSIVEFSHSDLLSVYGCYFAEIPMSKVNKFTQIQTTSSLKPQDL